MRFLLTTATAGFFLLLYMALLASAAPVVRYARYVPARWPPQARAQRILFLSDTHASWPDSTPARLASIAATVNRLHPDIVLLGGDFMSHKMLSRAYAPAEAIRPLAALHGSAGVFAVLGNHDYQENGQAVREALVRNGVQLLENKAIRIGAIAIGGLDDDFTGRADPAAVGAQLRQLGGTPLVLSHSPDIFPRLPQSIGLVLAGHTHCGQISPPLIGALFTASRYGRRFACGVIRESGHAMIVSAGTGTSILPLRLGAPPDIWVIDVGR